MGVRIVRDVSEGTSAIELCLIEPPLSSTEILQTLNLSGSEDCVTLRLRNKT